MDGASWTTAEDIEVANAFISFVTADSQQRDAIQYGIRPGNDQQLKIWNDFHLASTTWNIISNPGSPFTLANGVLPNVTDETIPSLPFPSRK